MNLPFTLKFCFVCYIFMTSWNSRFPWSCPKLPVQLYLPNKQNLHGSPYKTWTFPFYFCLYARTPFLLRLVQILLHVRLGQFLPTPQNHGETIFLPPNDCRFFFYINRDIFCTFCLLFLWFCIHFSFFLLDVSIRRAGAFIFMWSK